MIPLLVRLPPYSSIPSLFKPGAEQTGLFSREGHTAVDYPPPSPTGLYSPPAPCTPTPFLIICPHPNPMVPLESPGPLLE